MKNHYSFQKYCDIDRWCSYWHQIHEIIKLNPGSVLEIGVGDRVLSNYLCANTSIQYKSADIDEKLGPDEICGVEDLKFGNSTFDLVAAFEVLEHIEFSKFGRALDEIFRVSKKYAVLSFPHWGRHFALEVRLPFFKKIKWQHKFNFEKKAHIFDGQHHWEIGKKGYPLEAIKNKIESTGFIILKDYIAFESPYHHFFVLQKKSL